MDGPGIRTTVFFKGCPLKCKWCHNPESQTVITELGYDATACISCLRCASVCQQGCHTAKDGEHSFDRTSCTACGKCASIGCLALNVYGKEVTVDEVLTEVLKDVDYYQESGGGLTLSGGEPFYQAEFCLELLQKAKQNGLHTAVETCGFVSQKVLEKSLDLVDLYLFDFKETNSSLHEEFTGKTNSLIIENLKYLDANGKKIVLRCPIIPNFNAREEHFKGIGELANSLKNATEIVVEPYHDFGVSKYARLGREYLVKSSIPSSEDIDEYLQKIQKHTNKKVIKA